VRLLLDSHTLIWSVEQPAKLGPTAVSALQDPGNALLLGAGTIWEIAIKVGLKKLTLSLPYRAWIEKAIADLGLSILPITVKYADAQAVLPNHHSAAQGPQPNLTSHIATVRGCAQSRCHASAPRRSRL